MVFVGIQSAIEAKRKAMTKIDDLKFRYHARMRILELIERRRVAECDNGIGASIERQILTEECETLERNSSPECGVGTTQNLQK